MCTTYFRAAVTEIHVIFIVAVATATTTTTTTAATTATATTAAADADADDDALTTANDDADYVDEYDFAPTAQFLFALFVDFHHHNHDLRHHWLMRLLMLLVHTVFLFLLLPFLFLPFLFLHPLIYRLN